MNFEQNYIGLVQQVLFTGGDRIARNGKTNAIFGIQIAADDLITGNFPLLLGRKMHYRGVLGELAAFFKGPMCITDFEKEGCNYWKKWANEKGELKLDYGNAWIDGDQINNVIKSIKDDPAGRRHLITGWVPKNVWSKSLSLPCCHYAYQWYVNGDYLDMIWIQRSVDLMIGLPSDAILAAAWNIVMAGLTGYKPGRLIFQLGDVHIYEEHQLGAIQYIRQYGHSDISQPEYSFNPTLDKYEDFSSGDIAIRKYTPMPVIDFLLKE